MGHINPCSNLIVILEQPSNLRVSLLNLIVFISEMGVVLPAVEDCQDKQSTVLGTLEQLKESVLSFRWKSLFLRREYKAGSQVP